MIGARCSSIGATLMKASIGSGSRDDPGSVGTVQPLETANVVRLDPAVLLTPSQHG
ncbi:hypothetical protein [Methylorubrum extorquens]|uniref:hypothetical protein n=1 Tax=Methylorubrum extorquens TaxID=408 RepID=UPI001EE61F18|nr:hypothetical protein [Methylorubrum extorquens]MCG5248286.1 hypothetical protein [Methylorubrum extorquens]